jgi:voltage-gated potassium channel
MDMGGVSLPRSTRLGMFVHLALAFVLIGVSVVLHGVGTLLVIVRLAGALQRNPSRGRVASGALTAGVVSSLLLLHLLEASAWAALYWLSGSLPDGETALYFSLTSYTTVGYGDVVLPADWRLLGPIEAATGILMFGWSTGVLVAAINRIHGDQLRRLTEPKEPDPEAATGSEP